MSVSIHMNGQKRENMKKAIHQHQVRLNVEDGKNVAKHSDSKIDSTLSHMNINYFDDVDRFKKMRKKLDVISDKRVEAGGKKLYKSANVMMTGTLQLSDDTLEKLGWQSDDEGNKLPADKQSPQALKNVRNVYADIIQSVKRQPKIYGDVFSATLHLDESSPHIDFMSDPIDVNETDQTARTFLNGGKKAKKGAALRNMQDNIMAYSQFDEPTRKKFGLERGDSEAKKIDKVKTLQRDKKRLEDKEKQLQSQSELVRKGMIASAEALQKSEELRVNLVDWQTKQKKEFDNREKVLSQREHALELREAILNAKQVEVDEKHDEAIQKLLEASEKLEEASKLKQLADETLKRVEALKKRLAETWKNVLQYVRDGRLKTEKVEKIANEHKKMSADELDDLSEEILELTKPQKGITRGL